MDADRPLVDEARAGSQEAFAQLVTRYERRVFNLARALTASDADADDLGQEVFLRVYRGLGRFRGDSTFRTWLYRVAVNVIRSHLARRSVADLFRWQASGPGRVEADPDSLPAASDHEEDLVRRDAIDRALARLKPDLRVAVTLRDIDGLDYKEIADVTRVPIGTVMSRIARGREQLRPLLQALGGRRRPGR